MSTDIFTWTTNKTPSLPHGGFYVETHHAKGGISHEIDYLLSRQARDRHILLTQSGFVVTLDKRSEYTELEVNPKRTTLAPECQDGQSSIGWTTTSGRPHHLIAMRSF